MNDPGGYKCACVQGFEGDHCEAGEVIAELTILWQCINCLGRCLAGNVVSRYVVTDIVNRRIFFFEKKRYFFDES